MWLFAARRRQTQLKPSLFFIDWLRESERDRKRERERENSLVQFHLYALLFYIVRQVDSEAVKKNRGGALAMRIVSGSICWGSVLRNFFVFLLLLRLVTSLFPVGPVLCAFHRRWPNPKGTYKESTPERESAHQEEQSQRHLQIDYKLSIRHAHTKTKGKPTNSEGLSEDAQKQNHYKHERKADIPNRSANLVS